MKPVTKEYLESLPYEVISKIKKPITEADVIKINQLIVFVHSLMNVKKPVNEKVISDEALIDEKG